MATATAVATKGLALKIAAHRRRAIRWLVPLVTAFIVSLIAGATEKVALPVLNPDAAAFSVGIVAGISGLACKRIMKPRLTD